MIGNSVSIDLGLGDPTELFLINQDGYSAEYLNRDTGVDTRVRIRHTKEKAIPGQLQLDRHNVEITQVFAPSDDYPAGYTQQVYVVARFPAGVSTGTTDIAAMFAGLAAWLADGTPLTNMRRVLNWES